MAFPEIDTDKFKVDAEKAMSIPLGFASPLWFAYAGMASAGVAYWWMSQFSKPENLEAMSGMMKKYSMVPVPEMPAMEASMMAVEPPPMPSIIPEPLIPEPALAAAAVAPAAEAMEAVAETAPKIFEAAADDLTRLTGIGPTVAAKLADLGVKTFNDIASWTADDVEKFDKSLNLMGRVRREDWVGQAKQFAEQTAH